MYQYLVFNDACILTEKKRNRRTTWSRVNSIFLYKNKLNLKIKLTQKLRRKKKRSPLPLLEKDLIPFLKETTENRRKTKISIQRYLHLIPLIPPSPQTDATAPVHPRWKNKITPEETHTNLSLKRVEAAFENDIVTSVRWPGRKVCAVAKPKLNRGSKKSAPGI